MPGPLATLACLALAAGPLPAAEWLEAGAGGRLFAAKAAAPATPDATVPGDLYVEPSTLHSLGFEWLVRGDANRNSRVEVAYRKAGDPEWRQGHDLLRIQEPHMGQDPRPRVHPLVCTPRALRHTGRLPL